MKTLASLGLATALLLGCPAVWAMQKNNAILLNLGTMVFGNYELSYDRKVSDAFSVSTIATYYDSRKVLIKVFSLGYQVGLGSALKFHLWGTPLENSVYLSPYVKLGYLVHTGQKNKPTDHNILARTGITFGWAYVFDIGLAMDINWGLENFQFFSLDKAQSEFQDSQATMFRPSLLVGLGFAW